MIKIYREESSRSRKKMRFFEILNEAEEKLNYMEAAMASIAPDSLWGNGQEIVDKVHADFANAINEFKTDPQTFVPNVKAILEYIKTGLDVRNAVTINNQHSKGFFEVLKTIREYSNLFYKRDYTSAEQTVAYKTAEQKVDYYTSNCDDTITQFMHWCFSMGNLKLKYARNGHEEGEGWSDEWIKTCVKDMERIKEYYDMKGTERFKTKFYYLSEDQFDSITEKAKDDKAWEKINRTDDSYVHGGIPDRLVEAWGIYRFGKPDPYANATKPRQSKTKKANNTNNTNKTNNTKNTKNTKKTK